MERKKVFISYAYEDAHFVPLAARLLEIHDLDPWFAQSHLRGGDRFAERIDEELAGADVLLAVISEHAKSSKWTTAEIAKFTTLAPKAPVIPLLLKQTDLDAVAPGLSRFQAIDFTEDLLAGFRDLLAALDREFLSRKQLANRRKRVDRREGRDRRRSDVPHRVSMGLLVAYARLTGRGVDDESPLSPGDVKMLRRPAMAELKRYDYRDAHSGNELPVKEVVDSAFAHARKYIEMQPGDHSAAKILRILARYVCDSYDISMKDRRKARRRRGDTSA